MVAAHSLCFLGLFSAPKNWDRGCLTFFEMEDGVTCDILTQLPSLVSTSLEVSPHKSVYLRVWVKEIV